MNETVVCNLVILLFFIFTIFFIEMAFVQIHVLNKEKKNGIEKMKSEKLNE